MIDLREKTAETLRTSAVHMESFVEAAG